MTSRLMLISHAATPAVRAAAFPLDERIDEAARRDAEALAATIPPFRAAWTSPSRRTIETAEALNLHAKIEALLSDIDLGRWAGYTLRELAEKEPQDIKRWLSDPDCAPHGGESVSQLIGRASEWLKTASSGSGLVAAVSHPAVIRAAVVVALDAQPASFWRIDIAPLSFVELGSNGSRWVLRSIRR